MRRPAPSPVPHGPCATRRRSRRTVHRPLIQPPPPAPLGLVDPDVPVRRPMVCAPPAGPIDLAGPVDPAATNPPLPSTNPAPSAQHLLCSTSSSPSPSKKNQRKEKGREDPPPWLLLLPVLLLLCFSRMSPLTATTFGSGPRCFVCVLTVSGCGAISLATLLAPLSQFVLPSLLPGRMVLCLLMRHR
jgi:hypothetical protein